MAGVSLNAIIGDNGIITNAQRAKKLSDVANDEESIKLMIIENIMNDDTISVGQELFDRTAENGNRWNIIVEKETGKVYGTGYYFIPKGTILKDGQKVTTNWLVDKSGKIKELKDNTFTNLNFESTVGVKEGLIFNMDATNIDDNLKNWGENVTLRYFDKEKYPDYDSRKKSLEEQRNDYKSVEERDEGYDRENSSELTNYVNTEEKKFVFRRK